MGKGLNRNMKWNRFTVTSQCFTLEQVKEINKAVKEVIAKVESKEESSNAAKGASKTGKFFTVPCVPLMKIIYPWLHQCQEINRQHFGYDIQWQFHLDSFNYNIYGPKGEYDWHLDAKKPGTFSDIKLTCLLNLSEEPYEGGAFNSLTQKEIKFDSGMGLVINPLVAHQVTPITKGERITLTYWAVGPLWI